MYDHILLPIAPEIPDTILSATNAARTLLNEGGKISVLIVLEIPPEYAKQYLTEGQVAELAANEQNRLLKRVRELTGLEPKVTLGHPARTILEEAKTCGTDCIIVSSHRPGLTEYLLGSTANRIVRRARCSVLVIR